MINIILIIFFLLLFFCYFRTFLLFVDNMSLDLDLEQFQDHLNGSNIGVEDVDSQDVDMTMNMRHHNGQNQAEKRAHHNALERKRRDHIKGSFGDLRDVIPSLKGEKVRFYKTAKHELRFCFLFKASRAHVLKSATDYIRNIKIKNQQHQKTIEELKRQNAIVQFQSKIVNLTFS